MLSASVLAAAVWGITPFAAWQAAILALTAYAMGFFGGLAMSAIKRDCGVKDWGIMIDGHGGMPGRVQLGQLRRPGVFPPGALFLGRVGRARPPFVDEALSPGVTPS